MKLYTKIILAGSLLLLSGCAKEKQGISKPETKAWDTSLSKNVGIHDPSIFVDDKDGDKTYYVFGTHISQAKSDDLSSWSIPKRSNGYVNMADNVIYGDTQKNLEETFQWAGFNDADSANGYNLWAPDVIYNENFKWADGTTGAYLYYYSASSTWRRSAIGLMASTDVEGPYSYVDTILYSGFSKVDSTDGSERNINYVNTHIDELINDKTIEGFNEKWVRKAGKEYNTDYAPNALDPTVFRTKEGKLQLVYGSWSGGIYLLDLDEATGTPIYPGKDGKTEDGRVIDRYFGTKLAGGYHKSGEGSYITYSEESDSYYLYITYGGLAADGGYNMRVFKSKDVAGPYVDAKGNRPLFTQADNNDNYGVKVMGNYRLDGMGKGYKASGHNSILLEDGKSYNIFHTRFENHGENFELKVHPMLMSANGWMLTLPYEFNSALPEAQALKSNEHIGTYEMINHKTNTSGNMGVNQELVFAADGSVSGDVNGTYTINDKGQVQMVLGDVTYEGIITTQQVNKTTDKVVLSFVGDNNETIYASKGRN